MVTQKYPNSLPLSRAVVSRHNIEATMKSRVKNSSYDVLGGEFGFFLTQFPLFQPCQPKFGPKCPSWLFWFLFLVSL